MLQKHAVCGFGTPLIQNATWGRILLKTFLARCFALYYIHCKQNLLPKEKYPLLEGKKKWAKSTEVVVQQKMICATSLLVTHLSVHLLHDMCAAGAVAASRTKHNEKCICPRKYLENNTIQQLLRNAVGMRTFAVCQPLLAMNSSQALQPAEWCSVSTWGAGSPTSVRNSSARSRPLHWIFALCRLPAVSTHPISVSIHRIPRSRHDRSALLKCTLGMNHKNPVPPGLVAYFPHEIHCTQFPGGRWCTLLSKFTTPYLLLSLCSFALSGVLRHSFGDFLLNRCRWHWSDSTQIHTKIVAATLLVQLAAHPIPPVQQRCKYVSNNLNMENRENTKFEKGTTHTTFSARSGRSDLAHSSVSKMHSVDGNGVKHQREKNQRTGTSKNREPPFTFQILKLALE